MRRFYKSGWVECAAARVRLWPLTPQTRLTSLLGDSLVRLMATPYTPAKVFSSDTKDRLARSMAEIMFTHQLDLILMQDLVSTLEPQNMLVTRWAFL